MKFVMSQKRQKKVEDFSREEWREQDIEYFGKDFIWKYEVYTLTAKEKTQILGLVKFIINEDVVFVDSLIVGKKFRGQGIGKLLMQKMEDFVKAKNCHKIHLYTGKGWKTEDFYKSIGFQKTAELPRHFLKKDFVEYTKFLD